MEVREWDAIEADGKYYCMPCSLELYPAPFMGHHRDGQFHRCSTCGRDASYPHHRDAKLWELDNWWCHFITGMTYKELRLYASTLSTGGKDENMNDSAWDAILSLSARQVWESRKEWRLRNNGVQI